MNRRLLAHVPRMLAGYAAAAFMASAVLNISVLVQSPQKPVDLAHHFTETALLAAVLLVWAFPIWLVCVIACELNNARQLRWYAFAGSIAALFPLVFVHPLLIPAMLFGMQKNGLLFFVFLIIPGIAGGTTYWAIAGRKAGSWKWETQ